MNPIVSVVVCTFNRARLLSACLESLAVQTLTGNAYEVIVVDNNSTDSTPQIAKEFANKYPNFRVVAEPLQGLSQARNRGWREAHGRFVAYIDDDAKACDDWLSKILSFVERHPDITVFGGPYDAHAEVELPPWFPPGYGTLDLGDQERPITIGREFVSGTNMVFRRDLLKAFGGFNTGLGMVGRKVSYGEETRLFQEVAMRGVPVFYVPTVKVSHLIADYKITLGWLLYSAYRNGCCSAETFRQGRTLRSHLYGVTGELLKAFPRFIRGVRLPFKRNFYLSFAGFCAEMGALVEYSSGKYVR
jgi:glycosyltransferase involved in cell wall biosynthesis